MKVENLDNDPLYQAQKSFQRFKCSVKLCDNLAKHLIVTFIHMGEYKKAERLGCIHGTFDMYNGNIYTVEHRIERKK